MAMGSIQWVSAPKMQICNWLEASEGRSRVCVCVTLRENEIGQVRENKKVLSIGIFFWLNTRYWDLISYRSVAGCWVLLVIVFGK